MVTQHLNRHLLIGPLREKPITWDGHRGQAVVTCEPLRGAVGDSKSLPLGGGLVLTWHSSLRVNVLNTGGTTLALLGEAWDVRSPGRNEAEILASLEGAVLRGEFLPDLLEELGGCFSLLVFAEGALSVIPDACALFGMYWCAGEDGAFVLSSSPDLLAELIGLESRSERESARNKEGRVGSESYLPWRMTRYPQISRLPPNQTLSLPGGELQRFWPVQPCPVGSASDALSDAARILRGGMEAIEGRYPKIVIPLTAGIDSRLSLASFGPDYRGVSAFTVRYWYMSEEDPDVTTAQRLARNVSVDHTTISLGRSDSLGTLLADRFGAEFAMINSGVSEIGRCFYRLPRRAMTGAFMSKYERMPVSKESAREISQWKADQERSSSEGYNPLDLYYWENRVPKWASRGFTEAGLSYRMLNIFNHRALHRVYLSVPRRLREANGFFLKLVAALDERLGDEPVNPPKSLGQRVKVLAKRSSAYPWARYLHTLLRP